MALTSWIVPRILLAWVRVTRRVLSLSSGFKFSGVSLGFVDDGDGVHHLMLRFWWRAMSSQGAMLASWSRLEIMISEAGGKVRARERLRKSWVAEGPITFRGGLLIRSFCLMVGVGRKWIWRNSSSYF